MKGVSGEFEGEFAVFRGLEAFLEVLGSVTGGGTFDRLEWLRGASG